MSAGKADLRCLIAAYNQIIQDDPENPHNFLARGKCYSKAGEKSRAIDDFSQAIMLAEKRNRRPMREEVPNYQVYFEAYYERALAYLHGAQKYPPHHEKALDDFDQVIAGREHVKRKLLIDAYLCQGEIRFNLGQIDLAIRKFTQALQSDTNSFLAYYQRGIAHQAKGEWAKASFDFRKAREINPKLFQAHDPFELSHASPRVTFPEARLGRTHADKKLIV